MIYVTGDTHIPIDVGKLNTKRFPEQKSLGKDDYLIICGDFGGVWRESNEEKYWLKWFREKSFTTLFIDGNHENFERLNALEIKEFAGGRVHIVDDGIYHLMRGEVYTLEGKSFFTLGGASSHDREIRTEHLNWWREELPSDTELEYAGANAERFDYTFDYVITHCAPTSIHNLIKPEYKTDRLNDFLEQLKPRLSCRKWFFGHYHTDLEVDGRHVAVFDRIYEI